MSEGLFDFEHDELLAPPTPVDGAAPIRRAVSQRRGTRRYARLNRHTAYILVAMVILAPLPVGLNRPSLWLLWGGLTGVVALWYFTMGAFADRERPLLSARFPLLLGLALVIPAYAILQGLPLAGFVPSGLDWPITSGELGLLDIETVSIVPWASFVAALRFATYILFAMLVIEVSGRGDRARVIGWAIFWGVVVHAIWALVALRFLGDVSLFGDKTAYLGAATGTFINRNSFATFLGMGMVLGLALTFDRGNNVRMRRAKVGPLSPERIETLACLIGVALIGLALILTQSRLGIAASVLGVAVCVFAMRLKAGASVFMTLAIIFGLGGAAVAGALAIFGESVLERAVFLEGSLEDRLEGYALTWRLIEARPIYGFGFDSFRPAFELVHELPMNPNLVWDRAHSTYLSHWAELGLVVGSIPIVLGLLVVWRLLGVIWRREQDFALPVAALSALVVGGAHSLMDFSLEMPANVILLLAIIGLGLTHRASAESSVDLGSFSAADAEPFVAQQARTEPVTPSGSV
ncbi:MAG: O-antigen ligase family protein [Pseudomonadota bacterium]